jgi:hypothetical protein
MSDPSDDRHQARFAALRRAVLATPGAIDPDVRVLAAAGERTGTGVDPYLAQVRGASYRITDADVEALRQAGFSEDAVLELTLAAAIGEATRRHERAMGALRRSRMG